MRNIILVIIFAVLVTFGITSFLYITGPAGRDEAKQTIEVKAGDGARAIARELAEKGIVRSASGFYLLSLFTGDAFHIRPGTYAFSPNEDPRAILDRLAIGPDRERTVLVREGETIYDIDAALAEAGVLPRGTLVGAQNDGQWLEGTLFPDTYRFYAGSTLEEVLAKFKANFNEKAAPLLSKDPDRANETLILASMLEREVPEARDRQVVAGILLKRLKIGMALQVDATVCCGKEIETSGAASCYPLSRVDLASSSPYNTYANRGWPPHPIGNPGRGAIEAALNPIQSPYWYYLSDPATQKTIFATTLDEQASNRLLYLSK